MKKMTFLLTFTVLIFLVFFYVNAEDLADEDKAKFGLAQSLNNTEKFDEAREILSDLYKRYPGDKNIAFEFAKALGYGKAFKESSEIFLKLQEEFPDDENIVRTYATVLEANQKFPEAREEYFRRLKKNPTDEALIMKIADISSWMGDYETAKKYYRELIAKHKGDIALKTKLADVTFWSRDYAEAAALLEEISSTPEGDKERFTNLCYAYLSLNCYDKAVECYQRLVEAYPQDLSSRMGYANALYASGRMDEAEREYKIIIERSPLDADTRIKLAQMFAARQKYEEAIGLLKEVLDKDPDNKTALLWLARVYSWGAYYPEGLAVYDEVIQKYPQWIISRREKARVLGWVRRYKDSIDAYQEIFADIGPDEASRLEMLSKDDFYRRFDRSAIAEYKEWLALEPYDLEGLFDLAQVYSRQMQWENAREMYNRTLQVFPEHFRAKEALNKVDIYSKSPLIDAGFEFYEADSSSRDIDEKYWCFFSGVRMPLYKDIYFNVRSETFLYYTREFSSLMRERISVGLELVKRPLFWASSGYRASLYTQGIEDSHNFYGDINIKPIDFLLATFSYERKDITDNAQTIKRRLRRDDYKMRALFEPNRRLAFGADYMFSDYTDGNTRGDYGFDGKAVIFYEPRSLSVTYRYEEYGFQRPESYYFTPSSFHTNKVALEWRHFLNKEELFWGSNDTFYTLRYSVNFDVNDQVGHTLYADFHKDWTDRFSTHVEWKKMIYDHQDTYSEDEVLAYIKYYF